MKDRKESKVANTKVIFPDLTSPNLKAVYTMLGKNQNAFKTSQISYFCFDFCQVFFATRVACGEDYNNCPCNGKIPQKNGNEIKAFKRSISLNNFSDV